MDEAAAFAEALTERDPAGGGGDRKVSSHIEARRMRGRIAAARGGDPAAIAAEFDEALQVS